MLRKYQAKFRAGKESMCPTFAKLSKTYLEEYCRQCFPKIPVSEIFVFPPTYTVHFFLRTVLLEKMSNVHYTALHC